MLQTIREHTQGWIAGVIITIIILTFALWGIHSYFVGGPSNNNVAEVNGAEITREQFAAAYERLRRQVQAQYGMNAQAKDENKLKDRALKALIDIEVLKQASSNEGFRISNYQIDNYLQAMPDFRVDGKFSQERFQEILAASMLSANEFIDLIKASLEIEQPKLGIVLTSFSLPGETNYAIALVNQERDIEYLNLPLQYYQSQPINISAEKIKSYYDSHKNEFMTPEQVDVEYIEVSLKDLTVQMTPSDADLKAFYSENVNAYMQPMAWKLQDIEIPLKANASSADMAQAQKKADEIRQSLIKGEDFTKISSGYSKQFSQQNWMELNQIPIDLQKPVAELVKEGQVSAPIKTPNGIVIIKSIAIREPQIQSFDVVKDKVKESYLRQHAEEKLAEMRDKLADVTYEHPDSLQPAVKALGFPIKTSELFTKNKGGSDISQNKKVRDVAFSNDILNLQNNSDVIQINPETLIVLRVKSHIPSNLLSLNEVSPRIENKLKMQEIESQLANFASQLKSKLDAGTDPISLATTNKLSWNKSGYIGRYSTKVDSAILDTAFRLPNPAAANGKTQYGLARLRNGYAIVALKGVKQGVADPKQSAVFAEQLQNSDGLLEYELYKQSQINAAKIKVES